MGKDANYAIMRLNRIINYRCARCAGVPVDNQAGWNVDAVGIEARHPRRLRFPTNGQSSVPFLTLFPGADHHTPKTKGRLAGQPKSHTNRPAKMINRSRRATFQSHSECSSRTECIPDRWTRSGSPVGHQVNLRGAAVLDDAHYASLAF